MHTHTDTVITSTGLLVIFNPKCHLKAQDSSILFSKSNLAYSQMLLNIPLGANASALTTTRGLSFCTSFVSLSETNPKTKRTQTDSG